ncbi:tetratricopeptide repeat protein [Dyadobacter subterraneus]|uniref:Tetratricopeptide repeat protein n=1 Tax=Dyadobacter subterraneus TaxID=2773304 RepID=A0ABR9WBJ7_9BACT|nr:tetratricopeptide repeat protein [Dyadobacter subterraneus]MBE9462848.1 tetratricopeptide repeat protein [Dyadobacter subterraneus]
MKKMFFVSALSLIGFSAFAQTAVDKAVVDQLRKDKEKSDKGVSDPKASAKASFWMDRATTYSSIASQSSELDSSAAKTALEAYKKAAEIDPKKAKDAQKFITGEDPSLFNAFVRQGAEKYQNKNLAGALEMFQLAQTVNTKDTLASLYGGIAAQQIDKKEEAKVQFEKYVENGGKDPSVFYGLAQLYRGENNFDKAVATLNKGLERSPGNKDLKSEVVNILLASGKEDQAIAELTALTKSDPNNVQNIVNLAILYDNMNSKLGTKIKELQGKAGSGANKTADLTKKLEAEKEKLGIYDGEVKRVSALLKKTPAKPDLKRQLADLATKKKESTEAIASLETEIKTAQEASKGTDTAGLEGEITKLKAEKKNANDQAIASYQKVLTIDAANYDALYNLGVFYFNEAVQLKSEVDNMNMTEYQQRGKEVEGRVCGRFKKAKPYFEKAIQVKDEAEAKDNLATVNNVLEQFAGKGVACTEE